MTVTSTEPNGLTIPTDILAARIADLTISDRQIHSKQIVLYESEIIGEARRRVYDRMDEIKDWFVSEANEWTDNQVHDKEFVRKEVEKFRTRYTALDQEVEKLDDRFRRLQQEYSQFQDNATTTTTSTLRPEDSVSDINLSA
ncbi:hypothetical protein BGW38_009187, partial [Lunasporangiospora selenospora]